MKAMEFAIRKATLGDVPALSALIDASVRELQAGDYTPAQIEESLKSVYGVDTQLIADGTYFAVETADADPMAEEPVIHPASPATPPPIVGCGGWSRRKTLYGGDQFRAREDSLLDPRHDAARIRAFFVHPRWARRGIGALILQASESAAIAAGFTHLEMGATLTGVPFYRANGYSTVENLNVAMSHGESLPIVRMCKTVGQLPQVNVNRKKRSSFRIIC